ncbi:MAG: pyrimidine 5'-nucleotidase [Methylophilaceae bacterium]|nr:pyrimidine 5'-nucleotidase [Methylophilaceae bacterium]
MSSTWIFDLDNTLHDAQSRIFPIVNNKMNQYISSNFKISIKEASILREQYWNKYGATLQGLIENFNIDPIDFLKKTHTINNFKEHVIPMPCLKETLSLIKGRKIIYTNAPRNYTNQVMKICKIEEYFDEIFTIEDSNFRPKPNEDSMSLFLKKYNINKAYFVDDVKENLKTAKQFGLSTIWLTNKKDEFQYIDKKIFRLSDLF